MLSSLRQRDAFLWQVEDLEDDDVVSALDELLLLDFVRCVGKDRKGRSVVVIVASCLQVALSRCTDDDTLLLCFMRVMEHMRCRPYVLVYCVGGQTSTGQRSDDAESAEDREQHVTQLIFDLFSARYQENMQRLYILHASFFFRMYLYFALPFLANPLVPSRVFALLLCTYAAFLVGFGATTSASAGWRSWTKTWR